MADRRRDCRLARGHGRSRRGFGLIGDIIVGIIGAVIAGWLLPRIGIIIGGGFIAAVINAFIGAVILLIIMRLLRR